MLKRLTIAITLAAGSASAADFAVNVENFTAERGIASAVIKVTNMTGAEATDVFVDCVFMNKAQQALDIGKALISRIPAGGFAYDKASIARAAGVQFVACSVIAHD